MCWAPGLAGEAVWRAPALTRPQAWPRCVERRSGLLWQKAGELLEGRPDHGHAAGAELPVLGQVADLVTGILQVALTDRLRDGGELILQVGCGLGLNRAAVFRMDDGQPQSIH